MLPDIGSALTSFKSRALKFDAAHSNERQQRHYQTEGCNNIDLQAKEKKHIEYLHDDVEVYDSNNKRKWVWTFFNKAAVEGEPEQDALDKSARGYLCKEDSIIENLNNLNQATISDTIWNKLYEAKCMDLGLPGKSDKL